MNRVFLTAIEDFLPPLRQAKGEKWSRYSELPSMLLVNTLPYLFYDYFTMSSAESTAFPPMVRTFFVRSFANFIVMVYLHFL